MINSNNIKYDYTASSLEKYILKNHGAGLLTKGKLLSVGSIHLAGLSFIEALAHVAEVIKKISTLIFINLANSVTRNSYSLPADCNIQNIKGHSFEACKYAAGTFVIPFITLFKGFEAAQSLYVGEPSNPISFREAEEDLRLITNKWFSTSFNQIIQNRIERHSKNEQYLNALLFVEHVKNEEKKETLIAQILNDYIKSEGVDKVLKHIDYLPFGDLKYKYLYVFITEYLFQKGELDAAFVVSKKIRFDSKNDPLYTKIAESYLAQDNLLSAFEAANYSFAFREGENINLKKALITAIAKAPLLDMKQFNQIIRDHRFKYGSDYITNVNVEIAKGYFDQGKIVSAIQFVNLIEGDDYERSKLLIELTKWCLKIADLDHALQALMLKGYINCEESKLALEIKNAYFEKGELDKVLQINEELLQKLHHFDSEGNDLMVKIVDVYVSQGDLKKAKKTAGWIHAPERGYSEEYIKKLTKQRCDALLKIINAHVEKGEFNKAKEVAECKYVTFDMWIPIRSKIVEAYISHGKLDEAQNLIDGAWIIGNKSIVQSTILELKSKLAIALEGSPTSLNMTNAG